MQQNVFLPADILLPQTDLTRWSVVACDQYSSEPEYWQRVEKLVSGAPSTFDMILPEAMLGTERAAVHSAGIPYAMRRYLENGVFRTLENSYLYIERELFGGGVRRGLIGRLDLEAYDYAPFSGTPVHSTEGTVEDRLPPRAELRSAVPVESPHIVIFVDDPERTVVEPAAHVRELSAPLYDFELMEQGGHIRGWKVPDRDAAIIDSALAALGSIEAFCERYGVAPALMEGKTPLVYAVGDGNHSLAAAKLWWESLRETLSPDERETHPARFALVELENIHDPAVGFEPIHRVIFGTDTERFLAEAAAFWQSASRGGKEDTVTAVCGDTVIDIPVFGLTAGEIVGEADRFMTEYITRFGGRLDYIHGDDTARNMAGRAGAAGLVLPRMEKSGLFTSLVKSGAFPRKSFSVGHANDKRFYLECRKIVR